MIIQFFRNCYKKNRIATVLVTGALAISLLLWAVKKLIGVMFFVAIAAALWLFVVSPLWTEFNASKKQQ